MLCAVLLKYSWKQIRTFTYKSDHDRLITLCLLVSIYMRVIPEWYRRKALKENFGTMKEKKNLKTNSHSHNQMLHCYQ